jgi:PAS domain S-box-containing protein
MSRDNWLQEAASHLKTFRLPAGLQSVPTAPRADDLFLRFFDLSLDLFCIADLEGHFLRVNPNFSKVLGYSEAELLSTPFLDFIHPDDRPPTTREMQRLREGLNVASFRNRYCDRAGSYHTFEWTAKAEDRLVFAAARNVSAQVALEEEIRSSRNRERAILNHTPAVIYVKGINKQYQFVNRQFAELFRVNQADVIGKTPYDIFPRDLAERFVAVDEQVIKTQAAVTIEEEFIQANGRKHFVTVKFPLLDARGRVQAVAGISTDVTDRLQAQQAIQELTLAHVFQRTLYPERPPSIDGLEIAGAAFPVSQVCGDYFDYIPLENGQLAIALGDVAGHGYKPALQMVELRSTLRALLQLMNSPQAAVERLNRILCADFGEVPSFVSFFLAKFEVSRRTLHYIGAGHDAFIVQASGDVVPLPSTSMVLGVVPDLDYPEALPILWQPGDALVVFTDGFNEAENAAGEQFGKSRVLDAIRQTRFEPAPVMIDSLFANLKRFVGEHTPKDDMTVVVVKSRD